MATAKKPRKQAPLSTRVRRFIAKHPNATTTAICAATGASPGYVYAIKSVAKKKQVEVLPVTGTGDEFEQSDGKWKAVAVVTSNTSIKTDNVNHPAHYKVGGIETIDFIEAKQLSYHLGNVIKYVTRADHKGREIEDLHKARWYLNREIARLDEAK